jgi:hypothetical protein
MSRTHDDPKNPTKSKRRPYVPPAIEETGSFERLALGCGHTPAGQPGGGGTCDPLKGGSTNS